MRREESLAAGSHPQSNSNQGSPASACLPACLPPTLHPITASTFPPTTLLLKGSAYYLTLPHTHIHKLALCHSTWADGGLVNNVKNEFQSELCEQCHITWRCTAPTRGSLWCFRRPGVTLTRWFTLHVFFFFVTPDARGMTVHFWVVLAQWALSQQGCFEKVDFVWGKIWYLGLCSELFCCLFFNRSGWFLTRIDNKKQKQREKKRKKLKY